MSITIPDSKKLEKISNEELLKVLETTHEGLTSQQADERFNQFGPNTIEEKKESTFKKLFKFFWGPIPWMIEIAALLSLLAKDWNDAIIITALLLFNAAIGFWESIKHRMLWKLLKQV